MHKRIIAAVMVLCTVLFSGCSTEKKYSYTITGQFDTIIEVIGFSSKSETKRFGVLAETELKKWNALSDAYHPYADTVGVYTINTSHDWVKVPESLYNLLSFGLVAYERTNGTVNMMCGAVTKLWKNTDTPPSRQTVQNALQHISIAALEMNEMTGCVRLTDPNAALDLGAFAKGYALQRVAEILHAAGFEGILNATSSVVAVGARTARVGLAHPTNGSHATVAKLRNKALATSGINQRFFTYNGKNYHHIIDMNTGFPVENEAVQVSVVCDDAAWADVYATAALIQNSSNVDALLYRKDGTIQTYKEWDHVTQ